MLFSNQAQLVYGGTTVTSNTVGGELVSVLRLSKSASVDSYSPDSQFEYTVTIENLSSQAYTGLTLLDDLGRYLFEGFARFPLSYIPQSASLTYYNSSGASPGNATVTQNTGGISVSFDIPGNTVALLRYNVQTTTFASPKTGSVITNYVLLSGNAPMLPVSTAHDLPVAVQTDLVIAKNVSGSPVAGQTLQFTFTVLNYGNAPVTADDFTVISDPFDPPLTSVTVTADGVRWTEGVQYEYNETFFYFRTESGAITLDSAEFTQDEFGNWITSPSALIITVTGTVTSARPPQSLINVVPAYADGSEADLSVTKVSNDRYLLGSTGSVRAAFIIMSSPDAALTLLPGSHANYFLNGNTLFLETAGLKMSASAYVRVGYGEGFVLQLDYTR